MSYLSISENIRIIGVCGSEQVAPRVQFPSFRDTIAWKLPLKLFLFIELHNRGRNKRRA